MRGTAGVAVRVVQALCCVLALTPGAVLAAPACKPKIIDSVPLQLVKQHYALHGAINGFPVDMMIDTGDSKTSVTAALVDKLGLPPDRRHWSRVGGINGAGNPNYDVGIAELGIGKFKATNFNAMIDGQDLSTPLFQVVLGSDVLFRQDIQIDFPNRILTFYDASACRVDPARWDPPYLANSAVIGRSGRMLFNLSLDGHPVRAVLDTGASSTIVAQSAVPAAIASGAGIGHGTLTDANGRGVTVQKIRFANVQFGREAFHDIPLTVADVQLGEADAMVGLDYWHNRVIYIAPSREQFFVLQPSHATAQLRTAAATP